MAGNIQLENSYSKAYLFVFITLASRCLTKVQNHRDTISTMLLSSNICNEYNNFKRINLNARIFIFHEKF